MFEGKQCELSSVFKSSTAHITVGGYCMEGSNKETIERS